LEIGDGLCADNQGHLYSFASKDGLLVGDPSTDAMIASNFCSQNKVVANYVGFVIKSHFVKCLFSGGLPSAPLPKYSTYIDLWYATNAVGPIVDVIGIGSGIFCYSYNNVGALPTFAPTPTMSPTINVLGDYTKIGDGLCVDNTDNTYTFASKGGLLSGDSNADAIIAANYCLQNKDVAGYIGLLSSQAWSSAFS
jgi:hypothetical protein